MLSRVHKNNPRARKKGHKVWCRNSLLSITLHIKGGRWTYMQNGSSASAFVWLPAFMAAQIQAIIDQMMFHCRRTWKKEEKSLGKRLWWDFGRLFWMVAVIALYLDVYCVDMSYDNMKLRIFLCMYVSYMCRGRWKKVHPENSSDNVSTSFLPPQANY